MLPRFFISKNLPLFQQVGRRLASSSSSKNYICDSSVVDAYQKNEKVKSIIDRQEHNYYFYSDNKVKQQPPSVFKQISTDSTPPKNSQYLSSSTTEKQVDQPSNTISLDEFLRLTSWNDCGKGKFPGLVGIETLSVRHGYLSCQLPIRDEHMAPTGYLHAGVVVTLADTACGYGCMESKPPGATLFTTIEVKANFMGTVKPSALLKCEARLMHGGKTTQVWDAEVKDAAKDKLIAVFRCTQLIIYPTKEKAK